MKLKYEDYLKSKSDVYYIELFLNDEENKFVDGKFYLEHHPNVLPMAAIICECPGKYAGAVLVGVDEEVYLWGLDGAMIKYEILKNNAIRLLKDNRFPDEIISNSFNVLVHNLSQEKDLTIICEEWDKEVKVIPGKSKKFIPWIGGYRG